MRRQSERRAAERERWRDTKMVVDARDGGWCQAERLVPEVRCPGFADDYHHVQSRGRGGDRLDPDNVLSVCRLHHDWIDEHPDDAVERGLLLHSWDTDADRQTAAERREISSRDR